MSGFAFTQNGIINSIEIMNNLNVLLETVSNMSLKVSCEINRQGKNHIAERPQSLIM